MIDLAVEVTASLLLWLMFLGAFILWLIDGVKKKEAALHAFFSSGAAWIGSLMIKGLFPTLRPFMVDGRPALVMFIVPRDGSFPSEHTAVAFALAFTIYGHNKRIGIIFLILAFLVGIARVLANVHYPGDILAGAVLGIVISLLVQKIHLRG